MPGITGIISKNVLGNENNTLDIMLNSMLYEPFYNYTEHIQHELGIYVAGVSIKESFSDCMPMYNEKKDIVMFLSGECFTDKDVIYALKSRGHDFNADNASYLIHLYEEQGESFLINLNGWFSGIIVDTRYPKTIIFNDRYGIQRIYYHENENAFFFSSEAKALLTALPQLRRINEQSIGEYFALDCTIKDKTFFSNIFLLPACSEWTFRNGNIEKKRYFDPSNLEQKPTLKKHDLFEKLNNTFNKILPRYFSGNSIGLALTGGLDTRMILASLNPDPGTMPCFTYGSMYRDSIDVSIARKIANECEQAFQVIRIDKKYLSDYAAQTERAVFITDGLADVCMADEVCLSNIARQIAPIKMTGKFGSQVMRRVSLLKFRDPDKQMISHEFKKYVSLAKETYSELSKRHSLSFFLFNEIPWYFSRFTTAEYSQLMVRSPYLDNDFISVLYEAPKGLLSDPEFQLYFIANNSPRLRKYITDRGLGGDSAAVYLKLKYRFLTKIDTLMNAEILPYNLHNWTARVDYLLKPFGLSKRLIGFDKFRHYRLWFREELSEYMRQILLDKKTFDRPYWNAGYIRKIVNDHIKGRNNNLHEIKKIMTVELIHRVLTESIQPGKI